MNKDFLSFYAQKGIGTNLRYRFQLFFVFFSFCFLNSLSAQDVQSQELAKSDVVITVVGDAFIYSKDESFNEQVSHNKDLKQNSKVELSDDNVLKIRGKALPKADKVANSTRKKSENVVVASSKSKQCKSKKFSKKYIAEQIKGLDDDGQFLVNSRSGAQSFISPGTDSPSFENSAVFLERLVSDSLMYSYYVNHFYKNSNAKTRIFSNDFSVRPPPALI